MGTLNQAETKSLQEVETLIRHIQKEGYDPEGEDIKSLRVRHDLEVIRRRIHTIVALKGYYPK